MEIINIKKSELQKIGYDDLEDWLQNPDHIYIGRKMVYLSATYQSKWHNPFTVKKYGLEKCLEMYENYIINSDLYDELPEIDNKVLGCYCKPNKCHGDILIKLRKQQKKEFC